uniref:Uncharacterized protein n=1 Tax=Ananas comosus var. bracteatus TaxID=296719 RepID=A0A6V7PS70_ANACO|nr:unnamed protein product [Ananas comosus var. bracteatus]
MKRGCWPSQLSYKQVLQKTHQEARDRAWKDRRNRRPNPLGTIRSSHPTLVAEPSSSGQDEEREPSRVLFSFDDIFAHLFRRQIVRPRSAPRRTTLEDDTIQFEWLIGPQSSSSRPCGCTSYLDIRLTKLLEVICTCQSYGLFGSARWRQLSIMDESLW